MEEPFSPEERLRYLQNKKTSVKKAPPRRCASLAGATPESVLLAFLKQACACHTSHTLLEKAAVFFARHGDGAAVGIRLSEGGGFPYRKAVGFSPEFVAAESDICACEHASRPARSGRQDHRFQCLCGAMVERRCDLIGKHRTASGSFFINDLAGFTAGISACERRTHQFRGRCAAEGYRSMALIPLQAGEKRLGLLQINDAREGRFTPAAVALWERLAGAFADALLRLQRGEALEHQLAEQTARRDAAEAALRESETRFRQMASAIGEVFWLAESRPPFRLLYVSPGCQELLGFPAEDLYTCPAKWLSAVYLPDRRRVHEVLARFFTGGAVALHEYRIVRPDGTVRWICNQGRPVRDARGRAVRIAGVARDITENKRLQEELLRISERERQHIGRELHDGLCQHLAGTAIAAKVLHNKLTAERNTAAAADMGRISELLTVAVDETRQLSHGLYPVRAGEGGLVAALARLAKTVSSFFPVRCVFHARGGVNVFREPAATHLFRIAQEAVNNAIKHGEAGCVRIGLRQKGKQVLLSIADNGIGIPSALPPTCGIGLRIMAHRAAESGGQLTIEAAPRGGTVVLCSHPAEPEPPLASVPAGGVRPEADCPSNGR